MYFCPLIYHMPSYYGNESTRLPLLNKFLKYFRWHNNLNPTINRQAWTQEEEMALIQAHQIYGNKWAELTNILPGRLNFLNE